MSWRRFFRRKRADSELAHEIDHYLTEEINDNLARGMSDGEARRRAYVKFGNPQQVREGEWQNNTVSLVDNLLRDLKYAARTLTKSPGFAVVAILVMALGIGANIALFTVVRSVLLNPLPYHDSERLFSLFQRPDKGKDANPYAPVDAGSFAEWKRSAADVAQLAMVSPWQGYNVSSEAGKLPEQIDAAWCSWDFFPTLGVTPAIGRSFTAEDDRPGAEATVILSSAFWKRRYSGDRAIVGKKIWLDARPYTVIGVMPSSFVYSGSFGGAECAGVDSRCPRGAVVVDGHVCRPRVPGDRSPAAGRDFRRIAQPVECGASADQGGPSRAGGSRSGQWPLDAR